jgi:protein required for attachment to host cells
MTLDAARARWFALETVPRRNGTTAARLEEVRDMVNPRRKGRTGEMFTEPRAGLRQGPAASSAHGVDDARDAVTHEEDRRFAAAIAAATEALLRELVPDHLIVVASPSMLGLLRGSLLATGRRALQMHELARDFTTMTAAQICAHLLDEGLLPAPA